MTTKVLLVGGSGFIGQNLKKNLSNHYQVYISGASERKLENYFHLDFSAPSTFESIQHIQFDIIIMLAASMNGIGNSKFTNPDLEINIIKSACFLQFIADNNITKHIVHISSMTVYAIPEILPVSETSKRIPLSIYGLSKKISEDINEFFSIANNINVMVLRIPGIFGGNRKSGYIYNTVKSALQHKEIELNTEGLGYWECMNVDDLCNIITDLLAFYNWSKPFQTFNISYGEKIDFVNVANDIVKLTKSKSKIFVHGTKGYVDFWLDNTKLKSIIPFHYTFNKSLENYVHKIVDDLRRR
jgi:nucleoside-diphosphate-sugar epimerase